MREGGILTLLIRSVVHDTWTMFNNAFFGFPGYKGEALNTFREYLAGMVAYSDAATMIIHSLSWSSKDFFGCLVLGCILAAAFLLIPCKKTSLLRIVCMRNIIK